MAARVEGGYICGVRADVKRKVVSPKCAGYSSFVLRQLAVARVVFFVATTTALCACKANLTNDPCGGPCVPGAHCVDGVCRRQCLECAGCASPAEACVRGYCRPAANPECKTSSACTNPGLCELALGAVCCGGACTYALDFACPSCTVPNDCDDNDPCTTDTCLPNERCTYVANTEPCDDGNDCTTGDVCDGEGQCIATGVELPNTACSDGEPCTHTDLCDANGLCVGMPIVCTGDATTCGLRRSCDGDDTCAESYPGPETSCEDGDNCTAGDACDGAGVCMSGAPSCTCFDMVNAVTVCPNVPFWSEDGCSPGCYRLCECSSLCAPINCDPGPCTC